jgi:ketosteroid isomerase-like protein
MTSAEATLHEAISRFLSAFRNLEWEPFIATFTDDATVFFPFPDQSARATGIGQISAIFQPFFIRLRQQQSGPPYLQLDPLDLQITLVDSSALVTFHIHDPDLLCRRSLLWIYHTQQWRLHHLHASNLPYPQNGSNALAKPGTNQR